MIGRYEDPAIRRLLQPDQRVRRWFEVEQAWLAARFGIEVPVPESFIELAIASGINEDKHGHDVLGFVEAVAQRWPDCDWSARKFHYGLTSSDVVDTAESLLIRELNQVLGERLLCLHDQLSRLTDEAEGFVWTTTHGRRAEPTHLHSVFAIWSHRVKDLVSQLMASALDNMEGRFRGPAGSYGRPSRPELVACGRLRLEPATMSFQALNRETRATWHHAVASSLAVLDGLAMHVKRWVCEERVGYPQLEWGHPGVPSSSMPHKHNPTALERVHGLSTLFASMQSAALHVVPMWDEREIAHSSVDRVLHEAGANWLASSVTTITRVLQHCKTIPGLPSKPPSSFGSVHQLIDGGMTRQEATQEVRG